MHFAAEAPQIRFVKQDDACHSGLQLIVLHILLFTLQRIE